jgi:streptogramin lyase
VFTAADGVVPIGSRGTAKGYLEVGPDGTAWIGGGSCRSGARGVGISSFDGETWRCHTDKVMARDLDIAPDGGVWVVGSDGHVYRIDPAIGLGAEG